MRHRLRIAAAGAAAGTSAYLIYNDELRGRCVARAEAATRAVRLVSTVAHIVVDYKYTAWSVRENPVVNALKEAKAAQER